jgi:hypothetical protein
VKNTEKKESYPLSWPSDWPRTRPQDQRPMASWKRTANQYRDQLATELERMGSPFAVISSNVPLNMRGAMTQGIEPRDVGVAVYFSRKIKEDFSWQDALNLHDPAPTEDQVQNAYRRLAALYHPDQGGDVELFRSATRHRDNAIRWINRKTDHNFDYVIACDQFREVRLNMAAIVLTIKAIRQIERCGTSSLLERAFKGFSAIAAPMAETMEAVR